MANQLKRILAGISVFMSGLLCLLCLIVCFEEWEPFALVFALVFGSNAAILLDYMHLLKKQDAAEDAVAAEDDIIRDQHDAEEERQRRAAAQARRAEQKRRKEAAEALQRDEESLRYKHELEENADNLADLLQNDSQQNQTRQY